MLAHRNDTLLSTFIASEVQLLIRIPLGLPESLGRAVQVVVVLVSRLTVRLNVAYDATIWA